MLLKFTYYAQYYAQEQALLSDYYAINIQFCMSNSLMLQSFFIKTVILECINERYHYAQSYYDCSIRVYRSFSTIFHKCLILLLIFILHFPIMLVLCLMLSMIHYADNYAGIIGGSLSMMCMCS